MRSPLDAQQHRVARAAFRAAPGGRERGGLDGGEGGQSALTRRGIERIARDEGDLGPFPRAVDPNPEHAAADAVVAATDTPLNGLLNGLLHVGARQAVTPFDGDAR